jgi:heat shock protein HslJ
VGCGSQAAPRDGAPGPSTPTAVGDPWRLIGSWRVAGDGTGAAVLQLAAGELRLWQDCGVLFGTWRADAAGQFVADSSSGDGACFDSSHALVPRWLSRSVGFRLHGEGAVLLDDNEAVTASLEPGGRPTPGPNVLGSVADPPRAPDARTRAALAEPAPLPPELTAADVDKLVGEWFPVGVRRPGRSQPSLELRPDGTYRGWDGCNGTGGRWVAGPEGRLLATSGVSRLVGCQNINVGQWFAGAGRAGLDGDTLVLLDAQGTELGRLTRA